MPDEVEAKEKELEPVVSVTYRVAAKIEEDYRTFEVGIEVPSGAPDEVIAQAIQTGNRAGAALQTEVDRQIAAIIARANAPTDGQTRQIEQLLEKLGVPPTEVEEALTMLGALPLVTRQKAQACVKKLLEIKRGQDGGKRSGQPKEWRWGKAKVEQPPTKPSPAAQPPAKPDAQASAPTAQPPAKPAAQASAPTTQPPAKPAPAKPTPAAQPPAKSAPARRLPADAKTQAMVGAMAFKLPFGPSSHPDWKGKKLGDIAALPEGADFLVFVRDRFEPTTAEGRQLKAHAITLITAKAMRAAAQAN